jgi:uncharacterized membrane protein YkvI
MTIAEFSNLGALAIVAAFSVKEFFKYLKSKKENGAGGTNGLILGELQLMNNNHLHELQDTMVAGNREIVDTIHKDNLQIIELLGEIKGGMNARR